MSESLVESLVESFERHRCRDALWARGTLLTYGELFSKATRIAQTLKDHIEPGDRVAIFCNRNVTAYVAILATILAGGAYVPLNPRFPLARNKKILKESGAVFLIVDERNSSKVVSLLSEPNEIDLRAIASPDCTLLPFSKEIRFYGKSDFERPVKSSFKCTVSQLVYVLFTSGSTGVPKGVPISSTNLASYVNSITSVAGICETDRLIQLADFTFDISVHDIFSSWLNGAALYSVPENAALMAPRFVEEHEITAWFSVPSTAGQLRQKNLIPKNSLPSLRVSLFCGEALTETVARHWSQAAPNSLIYNLYGPTEATVAISSFQFDPAAQAKHEILPLGVPFAGQAISIRDDEMNEVESGSQGEICLAGSQVASGYWQAAELTRQRFIEKENIIWYRTGDLGRFDFDAGFVYCGRKDHQVKIRGYRVELQEIENAIKRITSRDIVAVLAWPKSLEAGATGSVAFIGGSPMNSREIELRCKEILPDYMIPTQFIFIDQLPRNANGKIDYPQLESEIAGLRHEITL